MITSNFAHATDPPDHRCPRCGAADLEPPAKPTLEREQDGSYTCSTCSVNFTVTMKET